MLEVLAKLVNLKFKYFAEFIACMFQSIVRTHQTEFKFDFLIIKYFKAKLDKTCWSAMSYV